MGGKAKAPPPPDYSALVAASEKAAQYSYQLGRDQLDWAKEQYAMDREISDKVIGRAMTMMDDNQRNAQEDRNFYIQNYRPLEQDLIRDASTYGSKERREVEMGRAEANVAEQYEQARQAATRNLESFGIDPSSTRFAALDLGTRTAQAAATAAAGNQANAQVDAISRAMRSEAINVGKGYPGQVAATYGTALQSGNSAVNSGLATTASGANTMGTATQWQGLGNQSVGMWGNILNQSYQNQMDAWKANNSSSSGAGGIAGAVLGAGLKLAMSYEGGGAVNDGPIVHGDERDMTPGGHIPSHASPSGGRAIDDVPAQLTAGEFVVPKDVVAWKGEEYFQKLIQGSREKREQAPAKPSVGPVTKQRPTFASRPAALPME